MFNGELFQLIDEDAEQVGLLYVNENFKDKDIASLWKEFCSSNDSLPDEFVDWLNEKFHTIAFERVFTEEVYTK